MLELIVAFAVGLAIIYIILKILSIPMKLLWKFLTNSIVGAIMLYIVHFFGVPVPQSPIPIKLYFNTKIINLKIL